MATAPPQGVPVDQAFAGVWLQGLETFPGNARVLVHRGFRGQVALALAKAAIVDGQDRKAQGMQLLDAKQLAREVPAYSVQVEDSGRVFVGCRVPPAMNVLPCFETGGLEFKFLHRLGQAGVPAGGSRLDAKYQFALFVLQHGAADWQADNQHRHAQPDKPAQAPARYKSRRHEGSRTKVKHGFYQMAWAGRH